MKGSVRKRGDSWSYYFDIGIVAGKRKKKEKGGFKTKREAEKALAAALAKYNETGSVFEPSNITFSDYLDYYYDNYVVINLRPKTQEQRKILHETYIKKALGEYKLKALTPALLQEYANNLKEQGYAKSTILVILSAIESCLAYAVEPLHYIAVNPMLMVKAPRMENTKKERRILTAQEWQQIIKMFPPGDRHYLPLMIGYYCGLRIGEAYGLTWADINLEQRTISINKQLQPKKSEISLWHYVPLKTQQSYRTIPIGETLSNALAAEKARQEQQRSFYGDYYTIYYLADNYLCAAAAGDAISGDIVQPVCVAENGQAQTPSSFRSCSLQIEKATGQRLEYHSLRHTHATILIENGASPKAVQARLGHSTINITLQTYVHNTAQLAESAADIFENAAKMEQ